MFRHLWSSFACFDILNTGELPFCDQRLVYAVKGFTGTFDGYKAVIERVGQNSLDAMQANRFALMPAQPSPMHFNLQAAQRMLTTQIERKRLFDQRCFFRAWCLRLPSPFVEIFKRRFEGILVSAGYSHTSLPTAPSSMTSSTNGPKRKHTDAKQGNQSTKSSNIKTGIKIESSGYKSNGLRQN